MTTRHERTGGASGREDWWLTTDLLREGGDRLFGPYPSRELAEADRRERERTDLKVDSTPKGLYPPLTPGDRHA